MMTATNIHYELADRVQGLSPRWHRCHAPVGSQDRADGEIDRIPSLQTASALSRIRPCPEIAYNILAGGKRIEHLELRRNDQVYLNALGAASPTPPPPGISAAASPSMMS